MKLEICIDCMESARAALSGGADRIEVCGALGVGGITPSCGLIAQCQELGGLAVVAMIRPHAGRFCYGPDDIAVMVRDIRLAKQLGVEGIVTGALLGDGRIDRDCCRQLIDAARPLSITFHRAFDVTPDPMEALNDLLELGFDRLLTSGQATTAKAGAPLIRQLVEHACDKLSIMAGGGVTTREAANLVRATGVREVHASASEVEAADGGPSHFELLGDRRTTRPEKVRALLNALRGAMLTE